MLRRERLYVTDEVETALVLSARRVPAGAARALPALGPRVRRARALASCAPAAGSAATATATPSSPPIRCAPRSRRASEAVLGHYLDAAPRAGRRTVDLDRPRRGRRRGRRAGRGERRRCRQPRRRAVSPRAVGHLRPRSPRRTWRSPASPPRARAADGRAPIADPAAISAPISSRSRTRCRRRQARSRSGGALGRLIRAVETFGFHLATLDLRQNSAVHERVVAELLKVAGVEADYLALDEAARVALLRRELANAAPARQPLRRPIRTRPRPNSRSSPAAAEAHAAYGPACITNYIVSMAQVGQRPARDQPAAEGGRALPARRHPTTPARDHGGAAVRDDRRSGGRARDHDRLVRAARDRRDRRRRAGIRK